MERIENKLLIESVREHMPRFDFEEDFDEEFCGPGWTNADGTFVPDESAFDYAIDHCANFVPAGFHKIEWTDEFREMVVEWFYSDSSWVRENDREAHT